MVRIGLRGRAYFPKDQVSVAGEACRFVRPTAAGHQFITYFCPTCGTSLYWYSGRHPGLIGVAVGAFGESTFPSPARSVGECSMHPWAHISVAGQHFPQGRV